MVSLLVTNPGILPTDTLTLNVYDGNTLISNSNHGTLGGGETREITFAFEPEGAQEVTLEILPIRIEHDSGTGEPFNVPVDFYGVRNTAVLRLGQVDVSVEQAYFTRENGVYILHSTILNHGSMAASDVNIRIRKDDIDGEVIATKSYTNVLSNEQLYIWEEIPGLKLNEDEFAVYFVTVEADGDVNPFNNFSMAVAVYIEQDVSGFDVPPTGVADVSGATAAMVVFVFISAGLWGYILRRRFSRGRIG
jgi:hypothetical protein